jgi:hypothetical protein
MKLVATSIEESLNFERGQDPQKSMNLGLSYIFYHLQLGDILQAKYNLSIDEKNHHHLIFPGKKNIKIDIKKDEYLLILHTETPPNPEYVRINFFTDSSLNKLQNKKIKFNINSRDDFWNNFFADTIDHLQEIFKFIQ